MKRRLLLGVLFAAVLASGCTAVRRGYIDVPSICKVFPWFPGCGDDAAGGGGSGAGD